MKVCDNIGSSLGWAGEITTLRSAERFACMTKDGDVVLSSGFDLRNLGQETAALLHPRALKIGRASNQIGKVCREGPLMNAMANYVIGFFSQL
jgi:hypothetical protein